MGKGWLFIAVGLVICSAPTSASDVVKLRGGGSIRGLIVDHRSNEDAIKFRTDRGEMPILRSVIERIEQDEDVDARYWLAREYFDETAAGFYELALWCDANQLEDARDEHLNDVLRLDLDHAEARRRLGFVRRGRAWLIEQPGKRPVEPGADVGEGRANDGVAARRAERTEMLRSRQEALRKQQEIGQTVASIAARLESSNAAHVRQARLDLAKIRDPLAIGPLTKAMQKTSVANRVRLLETIGAIQAPEASYALAITAAIDLSPEVRGAAIDLMHARPEDRDRFVPVLEQALRSEKTGLVVNAADALDTLGERQSVPHLIDALMTPARTNANSGGITTAETQPNWVGGLKFTDVWGSSNSIPIRAPS
jgi:hypothetical protein